MRLAMMKAGAIILALVPTLVFSQGYPNRAVKMIIPFAPGGASDFVGRILQPRLGDLLGQPLVIENRPGASGSLGVEAAARSTPDGYTLFLGNIGSIAINPGVFPTLFAPKDGPPLAWFDQAPTPMPLDWIGLREATWETTYVGHDLYEFRDGKWAKRKDLFKPTAVADQFNVVGPAAMAVFSVAPCAAVMATTGMVMAGVPATVGFSAPAALL